jgi:hypothetical protein
VSDLDVAALARAGEQARERAARLRRQSEEVMGICALLVAELGARRRDDGRTVRFRVDPAREPGDADVDALREQVVHLQRLIETRSTIEQAKGIVMASMNCDADTAFAVLVRQSQHENRKLSAVARDLVDRTARPRARRDQSVARSRASMRMMTPSMPA